MFAPPPFSPPVSAVELAFERYRRLFVDLRRDEVDAARASYDFLMERVATLPFAGLLTGDIVPSGSLSRSTKSRPLDDIDVLLPMFPQSVVAAPAMNYTYELFVTEKTGLSTYASGSGAVNSIRLLNDLRRQMLKVPQYRRSTITRNMQVVNVELQSKSWAFDVSPAVMVRVGDDTAYAIPNGYGMWLLTDPRRDAARVSFADAHHPGIIRPLIRLLKVWNARSNKPVLPSYYFETLVIDSVSAVPHRDLVEYVAGFFARAEQYLMTPRPDPKGLGGPLDADVPRAAKYRYRYALREAAKKSSLAIKLHKLGRSHAAIRVWRSIFGDDFGS